MLHQALCEAGEPVFIPSYFNTYNPCVGRTLDHFIHRYCRPLEHFPHVVNAPPKVKNIPQTRVAPPSQEQVTKHNDEGGIWKIEDIFGTVQVIRGTYLNDNFMSGRIPLRWTPMTSNKVFCDWPENTCYQFSKGHRFCNTPWTLAVKALLKSFREFIIVVARATYHDQESSNENL